MQLDLTSRPRGMTGMPQTGMHVGTSLAEDCSHKLHKVPASLRIGGMQNRDTGRQLPDHTITQGTKTMNCHRLQMHR
jgi:hypothetical protein